ncbi:MAG TPA: LuxR C-terminal-related transcriptional regulator [Pirellulales bacterium]|nr:LuxR C-terminal-related transcriptional regulator [Pirellulales bacterium]
MDGQVWLVGCDEETKSALATELRQRGAVVLAIDAADSSLADLFDKAGLHGGCVVLDAASPALDPLTFVNRLISKSPSARCVALVEGGDFARAVSLMKAGVVDVVEKSYPAAVLAEAIQKDVSALAGDGPWTADDGQLSDIEMRLVHLTVAGTSNPQIAKELGISLRTVAVRRAKIMQRVGAKHRADLIRIAVESGWC